MNEEVNVKICRYINETYRPRHRSNRDFCLTCDIDEKVGRRILKEDYNPSVKLFKQICEAHNEKMSEALSQIGE